MRNILSPNNSKDSNPFSKMLDFEEESKNNPQHFNIINEIASSFIKYMMYPNQKDIIIHGQVVASEEPLSQDVIKIDPNIKKDINAKVDIKRRESSPSFVERYFGLASDIWISFYGFLREQGLYSHDDLTLYYDLLKKNMIWSIQFFSDWCIFTQVPKQIFKDENNRLHSTESSSIIWRNHDKNFFIHGIAIEPELWERVVTNTITCNEVFQIDNNEVRSAILSVIDGERLIRETHSKLISTHKWQKKGAAYIPKDHYKKMANEIDINLYECSDPKVVAITRNPIYMLYYQDPSTTRKYFSFVPQNIARHSQGAANSMAFKFKISLEEYLNLTAET